MPQNRFFIQEKFEKGKIVSLAPEEKHHLTVMRGKINDQVELINGKNELANATILSFTTNSADLRIDEIFYAKAPEISINLFQAYCHFNRLDFILEKCTELGVTSFYLFPSVLSEVKVSKNRDKRLIKVLTSAMKQCGRLDLPNLYLIKSIKEIPSLKGKSFFGDIRNTNYLTNDFQKDKTYNIFIGPEKGFTDEEINLFEKNFHAQGIHLHSNILRTDTAAMCFLSQIQLLIHS